MKRAILFSILVTIISGVSLHALEWPVPSSESRLFANFGSKTADSALIGEKHEASGPVKAAGPGELVFVQDTDGRKSRLPSPLGVWVACDHEDGVCAIYARMDGNSDFSALPVNLAEDSFLGQAGKSGWAERTGFFFAVYDRKEKRCVNPARLLPSRADTRPPVIQAVIMKGEGKQPVSLSAARTLSQGKYSIFIQAFDTLLDSESGTPPGTPQLAPFRFVTSVNGQETGSLSFETLQVKDGSLSVYRGALLPIRRVYGIAGAAGENALCEAGEVSLSSGQASLDILVFDINGNAKDASYRFFVE